jgi:hypothetical protein
MTGTYTPTRPLMNGAELATFKVDEHGRDYTVSCDGDDDAEQAMREGWRILYCWGRDGWDLGAWPYVVIYVRDHVDQFELQQIVEGDHTAYRFPTKGERDAAVDYLFLWYTAEHEWSPITWNTRDLLEVEGGYEPDPKFRGPYRA